jgi:hypothetical protein
MLVAVQPPLTLGDALISVSYGVTVFNEDVRAYGWFLVVEIVAVIAIAIGCIQLSRSLDAMHSPWPPAQAADQPATSQPADGKPTVGQPAADGRTGPAGQATAPE